MCLRVQKQNVNFKMDYYHFKINRKTVKFVNWGGVEKTLCVLEYYINLDKIDIRDNGKNKQNKKDLSLHKKIRKKLRKKQFLKL